VPENAPGSTPSVEHIEDDVRQAHRGQHKSDQMGDVPRATRPDEPTEDDEHSQQEGICPEPVLHGTLPLCLITLQVSRRLSAEPAFRNDA
jgi:hypothetical protein